MASVIITFAVHGMPLSFFGIVGIIALSGVIVNNAIVLIDSANTKMRSGESAINSIINAGTGRARPIFLTTLTTVVGILPTAYGLGGKDDFVIPIAIALGWGVLFGAVLTTIITPSLMVITEDIKRVNLKMRSK